MTPAAPARIEARLLPEIDAAEKRARSAVGSQLMAQIAGPQGHGVWERLTLEQRREVIATLCVVRILPVGCGSGSSIRLQWKG